MSPFKATPHQVTDEIPIPEEIDVSEVDGKTVHTLMLQVRVDVSEVLDNWEAMKATHKSMAASIKLRAMELENRWGE